jgi:hypothetical protein
VLLLVESEVIAVRIEDDQRILKVNELADDAPRCNCLTATSHGKDRQMARDDLFGS